VKKESGFTLIELLVVVAIIGILSSILVSAFSYARQKAQDSRVNQTIHSYNTALTEYYIDHNTYPVSPNAGGCLGRPTCMSYGNSYVDDPVLDSELLPYIPIPSVDTDLFTIDVGKTSGKFQGIYYACGSTVACPSGYITWPTHGEGPTICAPGKVAEANGGNSVCELPFQ
jgi:prepilin-type N-terminal cleavage/methylation domain-containing protein